MIKICFDRESLFLSVSGHAGYAERGRDIVCAGVSTLVFALGRYLGNLEKKGEAIQVYSSDISNEKDAAAFDLALEGLRMTERSFPEYIEIFEGKTN